MGWCGGTEVFDAVADQILIDYPEYLQPNEIDILCVLGKALQEKDWDCENESAYFDDSRFTGIWFYLGFDKEC